MPALPSFAEYIARDREVVQDPAPLDALAAAAPLRLSRPVPAPGDRFAHDLGVDRTARLRRLAAALHGDDLYGRTALFALCAAPLAALLAGMRKCRAVCIDTDYDLRSSGPWEQTIGRISRTHTLSVPTYPGDALRDLLRRVAEASAQVETAAQIGPIGERPGAPCRVLLLLDDRTFGPFGAMPVKVERLDTCYTRRKPREPRESRIEPMVCLALDSYAHTDNLRATFMCCGQLGHGRGHQMGREYIRLLDALLDVCEQPLVK
jgi:hypothetical protein